MANKRYIKNVIKSFKQVVPDAIGESLPGAKGLINFIKSPAGEGSTIKETFKEIVNDYKTEVDTVTGVFKKFKKGIKTGAFYDRDADIDMSAFGGDFDASFKDDDLFGDNDDWDSSSSEKASSDVGGGSTNVNFVGGGDDNNAGLISGAMAVGSARTVGAIEKGTAINFAVMNSIDARLSRIEEANQKFFSANLELLSSIKSNVEAMVKIQGSKETDLPISQMERLFGDGSQEFNLRLYMRHLSKKVKNNDYASMLPMLGMMNPMNMATMAGTQYLMKKIPFFATVEKMSKMLEGIGQLTLHNMANVKGNGMISKLFRFFGVKTTAEVGKVSLGKMSKGPIPFDGETKEAITRAIPGYLAKILNVMKHGKGAKDDTLEIYDNDQRQFRTAGSIRKKRKESEQYDIGEIRGFIEACVAASGVSGKEEAKVREQIFKVVSDAVLKGKSFGDPDMFSHLSGKMKNIIQGVHRGMINDHNRIRKLQQDAFSYTATKQTQGYSDIEKAVEHAVTNDGGSKETISVSGYFEKKNQGKLEDLLKRLCGNDKGGQDLFKKLMKDYKAFQERKKREPFNWNLTLDKFLEDALGQAQAKKLKDTVDQINAEIYGNSFSKDIEDIIGDIDLSASAEHVAKIEGYADIDSITSQRGKRYANSLSDFTINGIQRLATRGDRATGKILKKFGYAKGGYTGKGAKNEPAGVVHKDEYVVPKEVVNSAQGGKLVRVLEKLRAKFLGGVDSDHTELSNDLVGGDEGVSNRQAQKRLNIYQELTELDIPYDQAITIARMAEVDSKTAKEFIRKAREDKKARNLENKRTKGDFGGDLVEIIKNDVTGPLKEAWLGTKAAVKEGNLTASDILGKAKDMFPGMAKYAGAGLAAGFFLPGGPLMGAITGGAIGALRQNKVLRGYFFGEHDENGDVQKRGLFPKLAGAFIKSIYGKEVGDKAETNLRSFFKNPLSTLASAWKDPQGKKIMLGAGAGGILGSMFGPGGAIIGAFAGGMLGKKKQQSYFSKVLFGDRIVGKDGTVKGYKGGLWQSLSGAFNALVAGPAQAMLVGGSLTDYKDMMSGKISPHKIRANLKKGLANVAGGAAAGGLIGSFFGPGGTLIGALLGSTTGIRPVRAAAKRLMFGKENADTGKKEGGIFGFVKKVGSLAATLASFLANGVDPDKYPFLSKVAKVLGWTIGLPIKIAGGAAKTAGGLLSKFRKFSTSSHTVLSGKDLIAALNADEKASGAEKAIGSGVGIIADNLTEIKDHLIGNTATATAEKAEADNGANTAEEIQEQNKEKEAEKEKKEDKKHRGRLGKTLDKIKGLLGEGNENNKGILGTIVSGITSIIGMMGAKNALNAFSGGIGRFGGKFGKALAVAGIATAAVGIGKGVYQSFSADSPEGKAQGDQNAINGAHLGAQSSILLKMSSLKDKAKNLAGEGIEKAKGIFGKVGGFFKKVGGKIASGAKTAFSWIKDKASALKGIFKETKGVIPKLFKKLSKLVSKFAKRVPLLGAFFVAIEEIMAVKKFVDQGGTSTDKSVSSISPRERILDLVKNSATAFVDLIMLIVSGALTVLLPGIGAAIAGLIAVIDVALSFISGEGIAEYAGKYIAESLGPSIADIFGWTEARNTAWKNGQLEEYDKKHEKDVVNNAKAFVEKVQKEEKPTAIPPVNTTAAPAPAPTAAPGTKPPEPAAPAPAPAAPAPAKAPEFDHERHGKLTIEKFNQRKAAFEARKKAAEDAGKKFNGQFDEQAQLTLAEEEARAEILKEMAAKAGSNETASPGSFDINTYDITKPVKNIWDYVQVIGSGGKETIDKLDSEVKDNLGHLGYIYYSLYGEKLPVNSAYRNPNTQGRIYENGNKDVMELANRATGKKPGQYLSEFKTNFPGTSDHETGFAIDIWNADLPKQNRKKDEIMTRMFGYTGSDPAIVTDPKNPKAHKFKYKDDSVLGIFNRLKSKAKLPGMYRASGGWRPKSQDWNEHWHIQSTPDPKNDAKRWRESYDARVHAIDTLDNQIKALSGGKKELKQSVRDIYTSKELPLDKDGKPYRPKQIHTKYGVQHPNITQTASTGGKGDTGDDETSSSSSGNIINNSEITDLLKGILTAILSLNKGTDNSKNENILQKLFIPSSEAFNPNESAMTLLGSRLCVGL